MVLLPGATLEDAVARAEELRAKGDALTIRYAGGDLMDMFKFADDALCRAKKNGPVDGWQAEKQGGVRICAWDRLLRS